MATPFFEDWETLSKEDLAACRAKLLGFTEGVPDSNNELKEQLEALGKIMIRLQNGILEAVAVIATMEEGYTKTAAKNVLAELRKADEESRKQLFFLQVWKKHGQLIAVKYSRRKKGEYLDNDLAKVLEDQDKMDYKRERDRELTKERSAAQAKRFRSNPQHVDSGAGSSGGYRGGNAPRGRGGYSLGGNQTTAKEERKCYLCGTNDVYSSEKTVEEDAVTVVEKTKMTWSARETETILNEFILRIDIINSAYSETVTKKDKHKAWDEITKSVTVECPTSGKTG